MKVTKLVLHNFRSYADEEIDNFDDHCNVVVGRNGQGKSNLHIALMFLFSDSHISGAQLRREMLNEVKGKDNDLYVEATVTDHSGRLPQVEGETVIRKSIDKEGEVTIQVNGKQFREADYYNLMEAMGIRRFNPLNFMMQGKVKRVAQTNEEGLFNLLADVVGSNLYEERKAESLGMMEGVSLDEKKAVELLEEFREKLNELEVDKEDFEKYEQNLKEGNKVYHTLYNRKIENKTKKRKEIEKAIEERQKGVMKLREEELKVQETLSNDKMQLNEKEKELESVIKEYSDLNLQIKTTEKKIEESNNQLEKCKAISMSSVKDLSKKKTSLEGKKDKLYADYKSIQEKLSAKQSDYGQQKTIYDHCAILRDRSDKSPKQLIEDKAAQIEGLMSAKEQEVSREEGMVRHYSSELKDKEGSLRALKRSAEQLNNQLEDFIKDFKKCEETRTKAESESLNLKYGVAESKSKIVELEVEVGELKQKLAQGNQEANIAGIIDLIEAAEKRELGGVYGIFADLIECDKNLLFSLEALAKGKLYSIVVRDDQVADDLLRLNKEMKGPAIQIYPLTWLTEEERDVVDYPSNKEVIVLENHVKAKDMYSELGIGTLIKEILRGGVMVRSFEEGQKISKKFDCNCVTMEGQVIYSGGFLAQLGHRDIRGGRLHMFVELQKKSSELKQRKQEFSKIQKLMDAQTAKEQSCSTESEHLKLDIEKTKLKLANMREEITITEKACVSLKKLVIEGEHQVEYMTTKISKLKSEVKEMRSSGSLNGVKLDIFDERKFKETGKKLDHLSKEISQMLLTCDDVNEQIAEVERDLEKINQQLHKAADLDTASSKLEADILRNDLKAASELLDTLKKYLADRHQTITVLRKSIEEQRHSISKTEDEEKKLKSKLEGSQLQLQQLNQSRFDIQISIDELNTKVIVLNVDTDDRDLNKLRKMSDKELIQNLQKLMITKYKYTEKDKANFERLEEYFRAHNEYEAELKDLKVSTSTFYDIVSKPY